MSEDETDLAIKQIARAYARGLTSAKSEFPMDPKAAGRRAQEVLERAIMAQGGRAFQSEPITGVTARRGGQSRYDAVFNLKGTDIYIEVQSSGYHHGHKLVQLRGQVIGLAEVSRTGIPARYYKIIGDPRVIHRWSKRAAQNALARGDYEPKTTMLY